MNLGFHGEKREVVEVVVAGAGVGAAKSNRGNLAHVVSTVQKSSNNQTVK